MCDGGQHSNFGTETPLSVLEPVRIICEEMGKPSLLPKMLNEATYEIREQYLDCGKVRCLLGCVPEYTLAGGFGGHSRLGQELAERPLAP